MKVTWTFDRPGENTVDLNGKERKGQKEKEKFD